MNYLSSAYLPSIHYFSKLLLGNVCIEQHDNYIKQSYRNRCNVLSANGPVSMTVPIEKTEILKCSMKDIRISDHGNWQQVHWNTLVSAYNSTPFFEYYKDDFYPFFHTKYNFLFDFNEHLRFLICELIGIESTVKYSTVYQPQLPASDVDLRDMIHPKKKWEDSHYLPIPYYQVFEQRFGFVGNLSIVDLLFNMGNESLIVLNKSTII